MELNKTQQSRQLMFKRQNHTFHGETLGLGEKNGIEANHANSGCL